MQLLAEATDDMAGEKEVAKAQIAAAEKELREVMKRDKAPWNF